MIGTETSLILILNGIYFYLLSRLLHSKAITICSYLFIMTGNIFIIKPYKILNGTFGDIKIFFIFSLGLIFLLSGYLTFGLLIQMISVIYFIKRKFNLKELLKKIPFNIFKLINIF